MHACPSRDLAGWPRARVFTERHRYGFARFHKLVPTYGQSLCDKWEKTTRLYNTPCLHRGRKGSETGSPCCQNGTCQFDMILLIAISHFRSQILSTCKPRSSAAPSGNGPQPQLGRRTPLGLAVSQSVHRRRVHTLCHARKDWRVWGYDGSEVPEATRALAGLGARPL